MGRWGAFTVTPLGRAADRRDRAAPPPRRCPSSGTRLGTADASTASKSTTGRQAYDLLTTGFGAGFNGPVPIVVDQGADQQAAAEGLPGGQAAAEVVGGLRAEARSTTRARTSRLVVISPATKPQDAKTDDLIDTLRDGHGARRRSGK